MAPDPLLSIQVQFSFWLLRYICTFMLFILGMKAPGLPRKPYMLLVNEEERDVENSQVSPRAGAVWGHIIIESFRLEKTFEIIKSNR